MNIFDLLKTILITLIKLVDGANVYFNNLDFRISITAVLLASLVVMITIFKKSNWKVLLLSFVLAFLIPQISYLLTKIPKK